MHPDDLVDDALGDAGDAEVFGEVIADDGAELGRNTGRVFGARSRRKNFLQTSSQRSGENL